MLVLSRKANEEIVIAGDIVVKVFKIGRSVVQIGVDAPKDMRIERRQGNDGETDNGKDRG